LNAPPDQIEVLTLRGKLWQNGFRPIAVYSPGAVEWTGKAIANAGKRPKGNDWTERARLNPPDASIQKTESDALNTGVLCDGLIAVDIDVDDAAIVSQIEAALLHFLGTAPKRTRANSARALLLYRAASGEPSKQSITGPGGKVESLGRGQQFVAYGSHPSGAAYEWPNGAPDSFHRGTLTPVTEEALFAFLSACAPLIGAECPKPLTNAPTPFSVAPDAAQVVTERDRSNALAALADEVATLSAMREGSSRNAALNTAAHSLGTLCNGSIEAETVALALLEAATVNGHVLKHGQDQTKATIQSGLYAGMKKPRLLLSNDAPDIDISAMLANGIAKCKSKQAKQPTQASGKRSVTVLQGSQIHEQPIEWLWNGYLPSGKLTLLAGAGGTGKSTIAFNLAATITNAGIWPDNTRCNVAGNVLIWSSEDDPADTIKPRLMAVGANDSRYGVISGTIDDEGLRCAFDAAQDMDSLRYAVTRIGGISLLIIDPIVTAVTGDMHKANDVRRSLQSIVDFAAEMRCAVLGITHFAKGTAGKNSAERVIGSQAFAALARMVLVAAKEEDSDRRVFTRAKSNNSIDTGGFSYSIEALTLQRGIIATRVVWGEPLEGSSRSILSEIEGDSPEDGGTKLAQAKAFLLEMLKNGFVPQKELFEHARETQGITDGTMRRACKALSITPRKLAMNGGWVWELPITINAR
jgi:hypothetical protein